MALVIAGLRECWPVVGWRILDSRYFGVAQRRRRVFFVCGPTEAGVAQVLALTEGGAGDSQTGGEAGADVAPTIVGGVAGTRSHGKPSGSDRRPLVVSHALSAGAGGSKFGSGLDGQDDFVVGTISASTGEPGGKKHGHGWGQQEWESGYIMPVADPGVQLGSAVRRLTPLECERLQKFPDGHTCLCQPLEAYAEDPDAAALRCTCPDSPRYRALGNAVTVSVVEWIGRRLMAAL